MSFFSFLKSFFEENSAQNIDKDDNWKFKSSSSPEIVNNNTYNKPNVLIPQRSVPEHILRNPVLNSPKDITDDLIQRIIDNNLTSLTISYEFTSAPKTNNDEQWKEDRLKYNPFWRANKLKEIKSIDFEIILSPTVHSLDFAFAYFKELEYLNLKNTSNITSMKGRWF